MYIRRLVVIPHAVRPLVIASLATSALLVTSPMPGDSSVTASPPTERQSPVARPERPAVPGRAVEASADEELSAATAVAPTRRQPYSDPEWYPLRRSALNSLVNPPRGGPYSAVVGCVWHNCPHSGHRFWAIDFVADKGDPVFAAGGGRFHVGNIDPGCSTSGERGGTWGWIDHGGGVISRYHHLSSIARSRDGQLVGPRTKIGEVGKSGNTCSSDAKYLHFEVRQGGASGRRLQVPQLKACRRDGTKISLPKAMNSNYWSWDNVPYRGPGVPATTSECIGRAWNKTPARSQLNGWRGNESARLFWSDPTRRAGKTVIEMKIFRPSTGRYSQPIYRYIDGAPSSQVISGLVNGRPYRFRVAFRNKHGWARWSGTDQVVPAGLPSRPSPRRIAATGTRVGYGWTKSEGNGRELDHYTLAIRRVTSSGYTEWKTKQHPPDSTSANFLDVQPYRTYQVRVKGRTAVGHSRWSEKRSVTTTPSS